MVVARIAAILFIAIFASFPALAEGQRVILVLDASGSMWGQVDGRAKMDIAKEIVGKVIGSWKAEDEIGLVAYGHRKKGACDDIETLIEPGQLNSGSYMQSVMALSPKGKTPMTQSVRQAAEALKFTEKPATVILVSDGIETCDPNPCAVAEELEKLGVALTVHTVGFGLDDQGAVSQLQCLAEKTGGISVLAANADELETALRKTVEAKVEEPPAPQFNFTGHVVMADGVALPAPYDQPGWDISFAVAGAKGDYVATEYGRDVRRNMEQPGDYLATVKVDLAQAEQTFTIAAGGTADININLNAGLASFKGMLDPATQMTNDGASWTFAKADGAYAGTAYGATPRHLFNAGDYTVKLQDGQAESQAAFTVVPGKTVDVVVTLGSGAARISATYSSGGEALPDRTTVELRLPADVSGEKKYIATDYGNDRVFKAAAGKYLAIIKLDHAVAEQPFEIVAGQETQVTVNLNAGFLAVKAAGARAIDILSGEAALDGSRQRVGGEVYVDEMNKAVNAGTYRVVAKDGAGTVIGEKDVTVTAGKRSEVAIP